MSKSPIFSSEQQDRQIPAIAVSDWSPRGRNTVSGTFRLTLASGMVINGCMAHSAGNRDWITFPGTAQVDGDGELMHNDKGRIQYKTVIRFVRKEVYEDLQEMVLKELRRLGHI